MPNKSAWDSIGEASRDFTGQESHHDVPIYDHTCESHYVYAHMAPTRARQSPFMS